MKKILHISTPAMAVAWGLAASAGQVNFSYEWTFSHTPDKGTSSYGSEIVAFDSENQLLWVVGTDANEANLGLGGIDVLDLSGRLVRSIDTSALGGINSVAISRGQAAVAITAPVKTDAGLVRFFDTSSFNVLRDVTVGANPDNLAYTPNGSRVLVANEGEPSSYEVGLTGDPEGSISIIDSESFAVQTAGFAGFNGQSAALKAAGVRLNGPNATVAQDLEPEFIAVSPDGATAFVTLQENNALAKVDIGSATVSEVVPMGLKDHSLPEQGFDASDRDGPGNEPLPGNIQNWNVYGLYMPDGIAALSQGGETFYVTANEGDSRSDWPGGNDEVRVGSVSVDPALDATLIAVHGADWKSNNDKLSRLNISNSGDLDGDGDQDRLEVFGTRSFSILDEAGSLLFESGDRIEQIIKDRFPGYWDDSRSDNKGPEPESVVVGNVNGTDLLFLALERSNAIMVWDVSDASDPQFLHMLSTSGDIAPEGLSFFSSAGRSYLAVANEASETTSLYQVSVPACDPATIWLLGPVLLGLLSLRYGTVRQ